MRLSVLGYFLGCIRLRDAFRVKAPVFNFGLATEPLKRSGCYPGGVNQREFSCLTISHGKSGDGDGNGTIAKETEGNLQTSPGAQLFRTLTSPLFSVTVGVSILAAVVLNRLWTPDLVDTQARTDILGVIGSGGLVMSGVYALDLNVKEAEKVTLVGTFIQEYNPVLPPKAIKDLKWMAESLLTASAATSVLVYRGGETLCRVGVMGPKPVIKSAPILEKSMREGFDGRELYLPALQVLPGKIEFDYLPENCQAVVMQPVIDGTGVVVIGTNQARAFTPKDIAWMEAVCEQATHPLRELLIDAEK